MWSRLKPVVEAHPETLFVLIHFSLRHSDQEVLAFFQRERATVEAGADLGNVLPWVHPRSRLPEPYQSSSMRLVD